ncbi:MAG: DNA translocase FtsK [Oscillospiraceae bacterium]|nr:DNA translocase FtsK [Oscillospiraceae bacterium]
MAQTNRKKRASGTSAARQSPNTGSSSQSEANTSKPPRRREIMAITCFIIGIFSFIGYFDNDPVFIAFFTGFVKRLIGYGFYALPPALIMCAVVLAFHKGRPILLRTICTLLLTVVIGALVHLFMIDVEAYSFSFAMIGRLWSSGAALESGGIVSGTVAELFLLLFGKVGGAIALICATLVFLMIAFNATITGLIEAYGKRQRRPYIPEPKPEYEPEHEPYPPGGAVPDRSRQRQNRPYGSSLIPLWKKRKIDIPLDENGKPLKPDHFADEDTDAFNKDSSNDPASGDDNSNSIMPEIEKENITPEDMPLDIPFMEGKQRRPDRLLPPIIAENTGFVEPMPTQEPTPGSKPVKKSRMPIVPDIDVGVSPDTSYSFPPLELLSRGEPQSRAGDNEVRLNTERLEAAFQSFGVNVNISNATRGPSVTRYEAELEAGIKLNKLTNLADDIAMRLGTVGVRIAAMPNRISTVGIEVPNKNISNVHLRDVLESKEFSQAKSKLTFAIGMDITGEPIVGDVKKLPHMLVAGTTGSGKSVCLNSIILSILYKASPEDARFIMIDPKMVEFKVYNSIPHLLVPVVTDVKKAAGALQWATYEMMKRYTLFSETNARDLEGYNQAARKSKEERESLPQIIVVIDELADLMMMAAKEVEESVCRIAQMGRAAGIHLIIATQSPRADVITGLMKANIPSRIAFKVSSALESRIILDPGQNADKLVGNGDMLYAPTGTGKPMRLQGTWVSDKEREKVIGYIEKSGDAQYSEEVMGEIEKAAAEKTTGEKQSGDSDGSDYDELLPQAVDVIFETNQASVSMLQRRLKLGYARAARIVDQMEEMGIVGPFEGSKPRNLLITKDQWHQMQYINGNA